MVTPDNGARKTQSGGGVFPRDLLPLKSVIAAMPRARLLPRAGWDYGAALKR